MSHFVADPYDPPHPDGPLDPDEFPTNLPGISWLDDEDSPEAELPAPLFLVTVDPE